MSSRATKRIRLESSPTPPVEDALKMKAEGEEGEDATNADVETDEEAEHCSICLQAFEDRSVLPTCAHEFCFECILVWSEQSRRCPLCSQTLGDYLIHHIRSKYDYQKHFLAPLRDTTPPPVSTLPLAAGSTRARRAAPRTWGRRQRERSRERAEADQLERAIGTRRWVYAHGLYAKHVASNTFTRYRPFPTPAQFVASPDLASRATAFIRRELRVWPNMDVEFLTTFILSLMKSIDIRSESAVKLLAEFLDMDAPYVLGRRHTNAEHFAHELYAYLRSPYRDLYVYDGVVQYDAPEDVPPPPAHEPRGQRWRADPSPGPSRHAPDHDHDHDYRSPRVREEYESPRAYSPMRRPRRGEPEPEPEDGGPLARRVGGSSRSAAGRRERSPSYERADPRRGHRRSRSRSHSRQHSPAPRPGKEHLPTYERADAHRRRRRSRSQSHSRQCSPSPRPPKGKGKGKGKGKLRAADTPPASPPPRSATPPAPPVRSPQPGPVDPDVQLPDEVAAPVETPPLKARPPRAPRHLNLKSVVHAHLDRGRTSKGVAAPTDGGAPTGSAETRSTLEGVQDVEHSPDANATAAGEHSMDVQPPGEHPAGEPTLSIKGAASASDPRRIMQRTRARLAKLRGEAVAGITPSAVSTPTAEHAPTDAMDMATQFHPASGTTTEREKTPGPTMAEEKGRTLLARLEEERRRAGAGAVEETRAPRECEVLELERRASAASSVARDANAGSSSSVTGDANAASDAREARLRGQAVLRVRLAAEKRAARDAGEAALRARLLERRK